MFCEKCSMIDRLWFFHPVSPSSRPSVFVYRLLDFPFHIPSFLSTCTVLYIRPKIRRWNDEWSVSILSVSVFSSSKTKGHPTDKLSLDRKNLTFGKTLKQRDHIFNFFDIKLIMYLFRFNQFSTANSVYKCHARPNCKILLTRHGIYNCYRAIIFLSILTFQ